MKRILIIGSGGREHALAKSIMKDNPDAYLYNFGTHINPGLHKLCMVCKVGETDEIVPFAVDHRIELAIIGPEAYLAAGVVNMLQSAGIPYIGPTKELAKLETSKIFTRSRMKHEWGLENYVPYFETFVKETSANYHDVFTNEYTLGDITWDLIKSLTTTMMSEYVIKADGLKSGKGVKVSGDHLKTVMDALNYCNELKKTNEEFLIEEKFYGDEFSLMSFCDGTTVKSMPVVQDFKRAHNNNKGPNTGGMGSISYNNHLLDFLEQKDIDIAHEINEKIINCIQTETNDEYKGILYGSFIKLYDGDIKVIEYNCRFGDPECINVFCLLKTNLLSVFEAIVAGKLDQLDIQYHTDFTICRYLVPNGYPENPVKGYQISIDESIDNNSLVYASAALENDKIYQKGSRTLAIVARGSTMKEAREKVETEIKKITGALWGRTDIGTSQISYSGCGVDIDKGNKVVNAIQGYLETTKNECTFNNYGDFGGLYKLNDDNILVSSTDGVGTKSILAQQILGDDAFYNLGQDIVNHCVNDILVKGAKPLFFLDYFASSVIKSKQVELFVKGASKACKETGCVLIGGETAEMPGVYCSNKVDLVGTIVGSVAPDNLIDGKKNINPGDVLIGFKSDGPHTNGFTLLRNLYNNKLISSEFARKLLAPHRCYYSDVLRVLNSGIDINGLCHITGGGLVENPRRVIPETCSIYWNNYEMPELFQCIQESGNINIHELRKVFNCGIGMIMFIPKEQKKTCMDLFDSDYIIDLGYTYNIN